MKNHSLIPRTTGHTPMQTHRSLLAAIIIALPAAHAQGQATLIKQEAEVNASYGGGGPGNSWTGEDSNTGAESAEINGQDEDEWLWLGDFYNIEASWNFQIQTELGGSNITGFGVGNVNWAGAGGTSLFISGGGQARTWFLLDEPVEYTLSGAIDAGNARGVSLRNGSGGTIRSAINRPDGFNFTGTLGPGVYSVGGGLSANYNFRPTTTMNFTLSFDTIDDPDQPPEPVAFIGGITRPSGSINAPEVYSVTTKRRTKQLFNAETDLGLTGTPPGLTGLAADSLMGRWIAAATEQGLSALYSISFETIETVGITSIQYRDEDDNRVSMKIDGLAFDTLRRELYATTEEPSPSVPEGLYKIDLLTGDATLIIEYEPDDQPSAFRIGAIDYDPATDRIYLADDELALGQAIYEFDPAAPFFALNPIAQYSDGELTDVDGLGASEGILFFLSDGKNPIDSAAANGQEYRFYNILADDWLESTETDFSNYTPSLDGFINPAGAAAAAPQGECVADYTPPFGQVDFFDLVRFLQDFDAERRPADIAPGFGTFDDADILAWFGWANAGCN